MTPADVRRLLDEATDPDVIGALLMLEHGLMFDDVEAQDEAESFLRERGVIDGA